MKNIDTIKTVAEILLQSIKVVAQTLLNTVESNAVGNLVNKMQSYLDLLALTIARYQTISNIIATAQAEGRDVTDDELTVAEGYYDDSLKKALADLG